jgi:hypothetical protein
MDRPMPFGFLGFLGNGLIQLSILVGLAHGSDTTLALCEL